MCVELVPVLCYVCRVGSCVVLRVSSWLFGCVTCVELVPVLCYVVRVGYFVVVRL